MVDIVLIFLRNSQIINLSEINRPLWIAILELIFMNKTVIR